MKTSGTVTDVGWNWKTYKTCSSCKPQHAGRCCTSQLSHDHISFTNSDSVLYSKLNRSVKTLLIEVVCRNQQAPLQKVGSSKLWCFPLNSFTGCLKKNGLRCSVRLKLRPIMPMTGTNTRIKSILKMSLDSEPRQSLSACALTEAPPLYMLLEE